MNARQRRRGKRQHKEPRKDDRSPMERDVSHVAKREGLYVLCEGPVNARCWKFWCLKTGRWCMDYFPVKFAAWLDGGERVKCENWREAVRLAASRCPRPTSAVTGDTPLLS